jgi:hypothetical protein
METKRLKGDVWIVWRYISNMKVYGQVKGAERGQKN